MVGRAFLFDLDGTITKEEVLPAIARAIGLEDEIKILTDLTIQGVIPFNESFKMRFAMLRSIRAEHVRSVVKQVKMDENLVDFISNNKQHCFVATGNLHNWVGPLAKKLGCEVFANSAVETNGYLTALAPLTLKSAAAFKLRQRFDKIIAIGDGANDVPMFEVADCGIAYGGVHKPFSGLLDIADYVVYESGALCKLLNTL